MINASGQLLVTGENYMVQSKLGVFSNRCVCLYVFISYCNFWISSTFRPPPEISWSRNNTEIIPDEFQQLSSFNQTLTLTRVRYADSGVYNCSARNRRGQGQARAMFSIIVQGR